MNKLDLEKVLDRDETIKAAVATAAALLVVAAALLGPLVAGDDQLSENLKCPLLSPSRGIDVSEYQKEVDWNKVRQAGYGFAIIKATEGRDYKDPMFRDNWKKSDKAGLVRGAYHYFLFSRTGLEQARNFIESVPVEEVALPPVVDVEMGGSNGGDPDVEAVRSELTACILELFKRYEKMPVIYTNQATYDKLIAGCFAECPIWIASPGRAPSLSDGREWMIWQYTFTGTVDGVSGNVDLNVYNGGEEGLEELILAEEE